MLNVANKGAFIMGRVAAIIAGQASSKIGMHKCWKSRQSEHEPQGECCHVASAYMSSRWFRCQDGVIHEPHPV